MSSPDEEKKSTADLTTEDLKRPDGVVIFTLHSEPFSKDPPYASTFYEALGRMMVLWGRFEYLFDLYLRYLMHIARERGIESEAQISFDRRAKLFKKFFRKLPELADKADTASKIMTDAKKICDERNLIVHAHCNGFSDGAPPFLELISVLYRNNQYVGTRVEVELADLERIANAADNLIVKMLTLTSDFNSRFPPKLDTTPQQAPPAKDDPKPLTPE